MKKTHQISILSVLVFLFVFSVGLNAQAAQSPKFNTSDKYASDFTGKGKIPVTSIRLKHPELNVQIGKSVKCAAHVLPKNAGRQRILYQSLNPEIAKVSPRGMVTGLKPGTAIILCSLASSPTIFAECKVTVSEIKRQITFKKYVINLYVGSQKPLFPQLDGKPDKKNIIFTSSDPGTASVDNRGNVTALKAGTAVITAAAANDPQLRTECTIRITDQSAQRPNRTIFVGASRTKGKKRVFNDTTSRTFFITKSGARFHWFQNKAFKMLKKRLDRNPDQNVVLCMGVNDMQRINQYISLCSDLMNQYKNTRIYIATVTPVCEKYTYHTNSDIRNFNKKLKATFGKKVIDTHGYLMKIGYNTVDGVHYDSPTSAKELNYILNAIS